jgi:hypothetical protein
MSNWFIELHLRGFWGHQRALGRLNKLKCNKSSVSFLHRLDLGIDGLVVEKSTNATLKQMLGRVRPEIPLFSIMSHYEISSYTIRRNDANGYETGTHGRHSCRYVPSKSDARQTTRVATDFSLLLTENDISDPSGTTTSCEGVAFIVISPQPR